MKIIDLLNKIANGNIPKRIIYDKYVYQWNNIVKNYERETDINTTLNWDYIAIECLNEEVEILEEEKKIPEKLPYYSLEKIQKAKNKDEWREERISLLEKRVNDLHIKMNDLLDYLKSKGE